ncbi:TCP-1/cpn60 chaperonin family protein [Pseudodonghicola flavimaris]|uniref:TCP-1/cpn60 chaperonin family protein n=1 Tax=Pseudodonghicola flavimaris TaxID=3050036 RepID=A0ABT7F5J3_9RHOB|nr:TCP-1/cpn60 chaperonin family protein [Pseudodonghicola flavimaris]MDK3019871.1 TCP-1/cpn60 chaperonin family protein [Pseudodonghicola flavimaris]
MSATETIAGEDLRRGVIRSLAPALRAIAAALGPEGRAVLYSTGAAVRRAETGTEIARRFCGEAPAEVLLREALVSAEQDLQDGSARLAVMFDAALTQGARSLAAGEHPTHLSRAVTALKPELDAYFAQETQVTEETGALLTAADLPTDAAALLGQALDAAGPEGHVELSDRDEPGVALNQVTGFTVEMEPLLSGMLDHMERVHLIVANDIISDFARLVPVIDGFARSNKSLVIAARGIEGAARQLLERNRTAGVLRVAALTPRDKGPRAAEILADLAVATGATLVAEETGQPLDTLQPEMLGSAAQLKRNGHRFTLTEPGGDSAAVARRLREIAGEIARHRYLAYDREHAERRHARLSGRWVELMIGPDRCDPGLRGRMARALSALRSARTGGQIAGAGAGLAAVADLLEAGAPADAPAGADRAARRLVAEALRAPERVLRRNAGFDDGHADWARSLPPLADPARLSRSLLDTSLSLALHLLTLETAVLRR